MTSAERPRDWWSHPGDKPPKQAITGHTTRPTASGMLHAPTRSHGMAEYAHQMLLLHIGKMPGDGCPHAAHNALLSISTRAGCCTASGATKISAVRNRPSYPMLSCEVPIDGQSGVFRSITILVGSTWARKTLLVLRPILNPVHECNNVAESHEESVCSRGMFFRGDIAPHAG